MVLGRRVLDLVGLFDERLGPGAAGLGEETDLSRRIVEAGLAIGYIRDGVVYHTIDETRLTLASLCEQERRVARSRFLMRPGRGGLLGLCLKLAEVSLAWIGSSLVRDEARAIRNRGRVAFYAEMLRLRWRHPRTG
jgi:GT2 family glycosyltransferase